MTVADRIKQIRESKGLTQEELAKQMGYASKSAVSRTENAGDNIGQKRIKEFAKALDVTEAFLMGWSNIPMNPTVALLEEQINSGTPINQLKLSLDRDEIELINTWRRLDSEEKRMLIEMLAFFESKKQD